MPANEAYKVLTFDTTGGLSQLDIIPITLQRAVAGISYTVSAGVSLFASIGQDGDLYPVFDGETWNHTTLDEHGCLQGETVGICLSCTPVAGGLVTLRITFGRFFPGGPEASR